MTADEAIDRAARALHDRRLERRGGVPFDDLTDQERTMLLDDARAALEAAGVV